LPLPLIAIGHSITAVAVQVDPLHGIIMTEKMKRYKDGNKSRRPQVDGMEVVNVIRRVRSSDKGCDRTSAFMFDGGALTNVAFSTLPVRRQESVHSYIKGLGHRFR
jgi:hypothetical protein